LSCHGLIKGTASEFVQEVWKKNPFNQHSCCWVKI